MLTDEQREALEWAIAQAYAYPHPIEGESLMMKRGKALCEVVLAASAAPAEGREAVDERKLNQTYENWFHEALSTGKVSAHSDKDMQLAWEAALATAPTMSDNRVVAWECPANHAILREESPDMCDLRRREWRPLVYRDAAPTMSEAVRDVLAESANSLERSSDKADRYLSKRIRIVLAGIDRANAEGGKS